MIKSLSFALRIFTAIPLFAPAVFAQPPADDLNGKTIHHYVESNDFNATFQKVPSSGPGT